MPPGQVVEVSKVKGDRLRKGEFTVGEYRAAPWPTAGPLPTMSMCTAAILVMVAKPHGTEVLLLYMELKNDPTKQLGSSLFYR